MTDDTEINSPRLPRQTPEAQRREELRIALRKLGVLADDDDSDEQRSNRLLNMLSDDVAESGVLQSLFPNCVDNLHDSLGMVSSLVGYNSGTRQAIAKLWLAAVHQLASTDRMSLLDEFVDQKSNYLFNLLPSVPALLKELDVPAEYLLTWLERLLTVIGNDGAQSDYWSGLRTLAVDRTFDSLDIAELAVQCPTTERLRIASFLLGLLRTESLGKEAEQCRFDALDQTMRESDDPEMRRSWHWSWATMASNGGASGGQIEALIVRADRGEHSDRECLTRVFCSLLSYEKLSQKLHDRLLVWIDLQAEKIVDAEAKHSIAAAARLDRATVDGDAATVRPLNWIVKVQPVPLDALGTWHLIECALVDSIKDKYTFSETFKSLATANGSALLKLFQQPCTFDRLLREIEKMNATTMISELIVYPERAARRVGLALFDRVGSRQIAKRPLKKASDEIIQMVFYELQCLVLEPKAAARLMWSIKPRFEQMGNEMLEEYVDLLEMQVRNYPGSLLKELKRLAIDDSLVGGVVDAFEELVEATAASRQSGVANIRVAGARRGAILHKRKMDRDVRRSMGEHSVLIDLCKNIQVLYGNSLGQYVDGTMTEATPFHSTTSSFEMPIVEFSDPEGMALRRIRAATMIDQIAGKETDG